MSASFSGAESTDVLDEIRAVISTARVYRHRGTVILAGHRQESITQAAALPAATGLTDAAWYGEPVPDGFRDCSGSAAFALLGGELDLLVFDAWSGFDPDAFGALTGSVRAGGLLVLLTPGLSDWSRYPDPQNRRIAVYPVMPDAVSGNFFERLSNLLHDDAHSLLVGDGRVLRQPEMRAPKLDNGLLPTHAGCKTEDQARAVEAVVKVVTGHRRRPVVLVSDRGRGKSAALGIAAARLIEQGRKRVLITAPRRQAAETAIRHARAITPLANDCFHYLPPDRLMEDETGADLLLVDEAAAIPAPVLETLLKRFSRIAFATTVHGYEGTGRGFAVRFTRMLDEHSNSWSSLQLSEPVRWAAGDPLEALVFRLLALDAEPADVERFDVERPASEYAFRLLQRQQLVEDEALLQQVFGLLVQAHYRTRPLDLRHMLDGPNLEVAVLLHGDAVAATALVATEGGFDEAMAEAVWSGESRPHGHLLPETLAAHLGLKRAPCLNAARIMRLTVHPALQRRGLGSALLNAVAARAEALGLDYVGTSFGATPELLDFWQRLDWLPVRLSIQKGASSGAHSALLLKAISPAGQELLQSARRRFAAQFPDQLSDSLNAVEPSLVLALLQGLDSRLADTDAEDASDLQAFAQAHRVAEAVIGSLQRFVLSSACQGRLARLSAVQRNLLVMRVLQKRSWSCCATFNRLTGRRETVRLLREAVAALLG